MSNKAKHPLYMRHYHMMRRCYDPDFKSYYQAGAIGLKVYKPWHVFENYAEDIEKMFGWPPGKSSQLARINPNKGWYPDNIHGWEDLRFVANNRRYNLKLTYKGRTQTIAEWARETGINHDTLKTRIERGYSINDIFAKPVNHGIKLTDWRKNK